MSFTNYQIYLSMSPCQIKKLFISKRHTYMLPEKFDLEKKTKEPPGRVVPLMILIDTTSRKIYFQYTFFFDKQNIKSDGKKIYDSLLAKIRAN